MDETDNVKLAARELRRLAAAADVPAYRRRQLLQIAQMLDPADHEPAHREREPFADGYYRRGGLRLRLPATFGLTYTDDTVTLLFGPGNG